MTDAERRLWSVLRRRRIAGFKFRRQQPIGVYVVDFFCPEARLIVEVDGSQHHDEDQFWYDYHRTKWLESRGYRVVRFTNHDVLRYLVGVARAIEEALRRPPIRLAASRRSTFPLKGGRADGEEAP